MGVGRVRLWDSTLAGSVHYIFKCGLPMPFSKSWQQVNKGKWLPTSDSGGITLSKVCRRKEQGQQKVARVKSMTSFCSLENHCCHCCVWFWPNNKSTFTWTIIFFSGRFGFTLIFLLNHINLFGKKKKKGVTRAWFLNWVLWVLPSVN